MLVDTNRLFAQVALGLLAVIFILSFLIKGLVEKLVSARLAKLMSMIESAEQGSFLIRASVDRYDEIGPCIMGFNQLLGVITQIQASFLEKERNLVDAEAQKGSTFAIRRDAFSTRALKRKLKAQSSSPRITHGSGTPTRWNVEARIGG